MSTDQIDVPEFLPDAEFVLHHRGADIGEVKSGDYVTAVKAEAAEPGRLVVTVDGDDVGELREYEPGMAIHGVVTGLMRRLS